MRIEKLIPPDGDPSDNQPLIRQPDGTFIGAFDLIEHQKSREASMELSILKAGDLLAMQISSQDETPQGCLFEVTKPELVGLNIGYSWGPTNQIEGILSGSCIPDEHSGHKTTFIGSGFGGSMLQPGIVATGRYPNFFTKKVGQIQLPPINNFEVFRKCNGELTSLDPNRLDADSRELSETHESRLNRFDQLMKRFGFGSFDIRNFSESHDYFNNDPKKSRRFEDKEFIAEYDASMAMGNRLAIFNKETGLWQEWKYFNFSNQDVLQVAFADLSNQVFKEVFEFGGITSESSIHRSGEAITTISSSSMSALNAISYKLSDSESTDQLGIPLIDAHPYSPSIQILPDGEVRTPIDYPLTLIEKKHPGLLNKAFKQIKLVSTDPITLQIGTETRVIRSPEDELQ